MATDELLIYLGGSAYSTTMTQTNTTSVALGWLKPGAHCAISKTGSKHVSLRGIGTMVIPVMLHNERCLTAHPTHQILIKQ